MADTTSFKQNVNHIEDPLHRQTVLDSFVVDENENQVTVLGTYGQDPDVKQSIDWRAWTILALCALAQMQNTFLGIAPAAAAYSIAGPLRATSSQRIWIVQAQGVGSIVTGPIAAIISDVWGRRYVVIGAFVIFVVSAIVGMTAHSVDQVIASQAVAGLAAGISGIMYAIASEVLPSRYRAYVQTVVNAVSSIAAVIALIGVGQATIADAVNGWRWVFRILLIFNALLLLGFTLLYHPPPRTLSKATMFEKFKSLDWAGYFLLIAGLVPLLCGFAWASDSNYGWQSAHTYGPIAVGFAFLTACLLYEWKGTARGFLDHRLFSDGYNFPLALFLIAVEGSLFYLQNNIVPSEVNGLWAKPGSMDANAKLLPFFLVIFVVAPIMSYYVTRTRDIKTPLCAGFLCFGIAIIGYALSGLNGAMATAFNAVGGIGFSAPLILLLTMVQLSTPPLFIGVASALTISVRTLGGTIGFAMAEGIYASRTNTQIPANIAAAVVPLGFDMAYLGPLIGFLSSGQGLAAIPASSATGQILGAADHALKSTQVAAYKIVWFAFLPGAVLAAIGCAFFRNPKERMNWVVDAPLKNKAADILDHNERASSTLAEKQDAA